MSKAEPQVADFCDHAGKLIKLIFECSLMCSKRDLQELSIALQNPRDLGKAEAERAQAYDLGGPPHFVRAVSPPADRGANRSEQTALFIQAQSLG